MAQGLGSLDNLESTFRHPNRLQTHEATAKRTEILLPNQLGAPCMRCLDHHQWVPGTVRDPHDSESSRSSPHGAWLSVFNCVELKACPEDTADTATYGSGQPGRTILEAPEPLPEPEMIHANDPHKSRDPV